MVIGTAVLISLMGVASIVTAKSSSYDYGFDVGTVFRRQSQQQIQIITGLPTFNNTTPLRVDIREFKEDLYSWNLLMLAMDRMKYTSQDDPLSWYQISGIHGVPLIPYNGVQAVPGGETQGYCAHSNTLFPTWHRPYVAFMEQTLYGLCQGIASLFNDTQERLMFQSAAQNFRLPYWDWSVAPSDSGSAYLPDFKSPAIVVYGPMGWQTIENPLFTYKFDPFDPSIFYGPGFQLWNETKRAPSTSTASALSRNNVSEQWVDRDYTQLRQQLYMMWTTNADYTTFSTKEWSYAQNASQYHSIEQIHDSIHMDVGVAGHMSYTPFSAFDPSFWLHHVMIDRVFALWQALWPDSWMTPQQNLAVPMWTVPVGAVVDSTTPLTPFYSDGEGTFWTSDTSRDTKAFGYAYAETTGSTTKRALHARREQLIVKINSIYGESTPMGAVSRHNKHGAGVLRKRSMPFQDGDMPDLTNGSPLNNQPIPPILKDNSYTEWLANVKVKQATLGGPFTILFFLGGVPDDVSAWSTAKNLIGTMGVFAGPGRRESTNQVSSSIPLTTSLMKIMARGNIESLDKGEVVPLLRKHMRIRVIRTDRTPVNVKEVEGLQVKIASAQVRPPASDKEFPQRGQVLTRFQLY